MGKRIITISREFGSGGRTIAKETAKKLGIPYYDKDLIQEIAKKTGMCEEFIREAGEYAPTASRFFYELSLGQGMGPNGMSMADYLWSVQYKLIRQLADKEPCVILGRCGDYVLEEREDCIHVFIHASMEKRAQRIVRLYGETDKKPVKRLEEMDKKRSLYYRHYTGREWGKAQNYTLCLDSGVIGIEKCVDMIVDLASHSES
ncbi:MAG: cytidylate kinase-like family protein [Blautia sp.]